MSKLPALAACACLAACATSQSVPAPAAVVATPCVREMPERPALLSDDDLRPLSAGQRLAALFADYRLRSAYDATLEAAIRPCVGGFPYP